MNLEEPTNITDALEEILEKEKQALIKGDFDLLTDLLHRKEELLNQFGEIRAERGDNLNQLKSKVARNQKLLDGAMEGIREVAERLNTVRHVQKSLDTYDRDGLKKTVVTQSGNKMEKRA